MDRRTFTRIAALVPLGLAIDPNATSQENAAGVPKSVAGNSQSTHKRKSEGEYNRHAAITEADPFAGTITFARNKVNPKIRPFALDQVALEPGPLYSAREWNRAYMMRLPNDRLLHNFRVNAALDSNAVPLGGWESPHSELRGHFVGHYLSAAAMLYAATADAQVKDKADGLIAGIAECQSRLGQGGYVSAFPQEFFDRLDRREKVWAPFYTLHKILAGALDMHTFAGSRQALDVAIGLAGWVDEWTGARPEEHMQEILNTEYGGMNDVLYNLAAVTNDDRWARVGDRFTKKKFFNPLAMRQDQLKGLHVNTHVPQVIGAAVRYGISSDNRFRETAEFFWETVSEARTYATGGSGNTESWLTNANHIALEMKASSHHQECCCAYNMMKLTRHLYYLNGDPSYIDYYERNLFNHRLGLIEPQTGHSGYFLSMSPGAWKTTCTEDQTFWCCTGTALEDFAKLNDTIYHNDGRDVYVNLFISSQLHWQQRGIHLRQVTSFPESDRTLLSIEATPAEEWTMYLRVPSWTDAQSSVRINGQLMASSAVPGSYIVLRRAWKKGDRIEFLFPMRLVSESLPDDPSQQAFLYGPIVLAGQFRLGEIDADLLHNQGPEIQELPPFEVPALESNGTSCEKWIRASPGRPLEFHTEGQAKDITFKPLNQSWERFAVYFKVT
jgi:DUF1680 family protein